MKTKIIGTGLSGLVGSRVVELLGDKYEFEDISRKTGTDISDKDAILSRLKNSNADVVIHMAAYTNVDGAEMEKDKGEESESWKINVVGTENIVKAVETTGKRLLYISTDFVFGGDNTPPNGYTEKDTPDPINWYGITKYEGELRVKNATCPWIIARIAYPYRANFEKNDFMRAMKNRLTQGLEIKAVSDHQYCPTFIDDIANVLDLIIQKNETGIFHVTGSQSLSPYDAALRIAEAFSLDKNLIGSITRDEYFAEKAKRPFDLSMNNGKIKSLGAVMKSFKVGLEEIKKQLQ